MKSRLSLIFAALVVLLGSMVWVVQDRSSSVVPPALAAVSSPTPAPAPLAVAAAATINPAPAATVMTEQSPTATPAASGPPSDQQLPTVRVSAVGDTTYTARAADTLSELALALLGGDSKQNRAVVIAANPTLQANPDLVLTGETYSVPLRAAKRAAATDVLESEQISYPVSASTATKSELPENAPEARQEKVALKPAAAAAPVVRAAAAPAPVSDGPTLQYSAQPGDTVRVLAASLLGGDTKANRDAIIGENASLQRDPDRLVAGQSYTIPALTGLAGDPNPLPEKMATTRPDAEDIHLAAQSRTLRYTAQPGDTVSKLAIALMGSDTPANRELIIKNNPSLVPFPHPIAAGQTYWIAAPSVEAKP